MGQQRRTVRTHYRWQHNYPRVCGWLTTSAMQKNQAGIRFQSQDNRIQIDWQLNDLMSSKINDAVSFFPQNRSEMNYLFSFVFEFEFPHCSIFLSFVSAAVALRRSIKDTYLPLALSPSFRPPHHLGKFLAVSFDCRWRCPLTMTTTHFVSTWSRVPTPSIATWDIELINPKR